MKTARLHCRRPLAALPLCLLLSQIATAADSADSPATGASSDAAAPEPTSSLPLLLGAQYTFILQHQSPLHSPYRGPLSLDPRGDTQPTNTLGVYTGWAPVDWGQLYLDVEKFDGAGVSNATGLAGLTNGDVVRSGATGIKKEFYIARLYSRFMLPLGEDTTEVDRDKDQIPGREAATRLELKVGRMAVTDDFDQNTYASDPRTEFLNWSLWANTAWDYAANTRGYTDGAVVNYVSPQWALAYGFYLMPIEANQQTLDYSSGLAHAQNLQLTVSPHGTQTIVRLLAYLNTARMGIYSQALAIAAANHTPPDIVADDADGRHKYGFGLNIEQPMADQGATGLFMRAGWNDGQTETFTFTEVDRQISFGGQLSGVHWMRPDDRLGAAAVSEWLSGWHRAYLSAGGCGFLLCDGRLNYAPEQILETYYRAQWLWPREPDSVRWQLGPDVQFIRNPGYNHDRGPVSFWGIRVHVEY